MILTGGYLTAPKPPTSTVAYTAPAPCCSRDCEWRETVGSDRGGSLPAYRIDCGCPPLPVVSPRVRVGGGSNV